jgi:hypothetical protein
MVIVLALRKSKHRLLIDKRIYYYQELLEG